MSWTPRIAPIPHYSRRILAWHVSAKFETASTVTVLLHAIGSRASADDKPEVLADGSGENVNGKVDELRLLVRNFHPLDLYAFVAHHRMS